MTRFLLAVSIAFAQEPVRLGPGVTIPRLIADSNPGLRPPPDGNGVIVVALKVDAAGRATVLRAITPAPANVWAWATSQFSQSRFEPARKNGQAVPFVMAVSIGFSRPNKELFRDEPLKRAAFESALKNIPGAGVDEVSALAANYAPAQYLKATWLLRGEHLTKDEKGGAAMMMRAAKAHYPQAMGYLAIRDHEQRPRAGLTRVQQAADLYSLTALSYLGLIFASGTGVEKNLDAARYYFSQCALLDDANCQLRLAQLILNDEEGPFHSWDEALAWLYRRADRGDGTARALLEKYKPRFTPERLQEAEAFSKSLLPN
jgi:TPR repeat protein